MQVESKRLELETESGSVRELYLQVEHLSDTVGGKLVPSVKKLEIRLPSNSTIFTEDETIMWRELKQLTIHYSLDSCIDICRRAPKLQELILIGSLKCPLFLPPMDHLRLLDVENLKNREWIRCNEEIIRNLITIIESE